eukprot:CAMPEP_0176484392 /NCGR_PEP_ID=MMETSP0200_2-20121128/4428_1 /TAXON_ID=947934 /ORGANISM="Chaetoceros sp., Strain GSL56" /LENGTH=826 /DNA_ID=CAMNT_0017880859 /DNA_START=544 /DNA_END=3024 /DNA_ORIENTATION=+
MGMKQSGQSALVNGSSGVAPSPLPAAIQPKGHDDISQISFDYGSSNTSLDASVGLNPYHDNTGYLSHEYIGMRWKTLATSKDLLQESSGSPSVLTNDTRKENQGCDPFAKVYEEKRMMDNSNFETTETNTVTLRSRMTSRILDSKFSRNIASKRNTTQIQQPIKIKKKFSHSQFQISPVGTSRKTTVSNKPPSGAMANSQLKSSNGRKENNKNVRLVLGSGKETSSFKRLDIDKDNVFVIPRFETNDIDQDHDNFERSFVDWPSGEGVQVSLSASKANIKCVHYTQDSVIDESYRKGVSKSPKLNASLRSRKLASEKKDWEDMNQDMVHFNVSELNCTMPLTDDDENDDKDSLDLIMNEGEETQWNRETLPGKSDKSNTSANSLVYSTSDSSMSIPNNNYNESSLKKPINLRRTEAVFELQKNGKITKKTPCRNIVNYDVTRSKIKKAAELNCILLSLFDTDERHTAAQKIQKSYRGFRDRYRVMQMIGIAKRKRWDTRTKSLSVTKIHSNFRRLARQSLRSKCEVYDDRLYVGCMAVEVLHVCSNVIQIWWKKYGMRLKRMREMGYEPTSMPLSWNKESKARSLPAFDLDIECTSRIYDCQRPPSATTAVAKVTSNTISLVSDHFAKDYYGRPNANIHDDDEYFDEVCNVQHNNFEASVSLLTKLHNGIFGRIVKIFRRVPRRRKSNRKSRKFKKRFRFFRKEKASIASPRPMLGDPEVNAELPDPLSLYCPLVDDEERLHDLAVSSTSTHRTFNESASQNHFNDDLDAFSLVAGSLDHVMIEEEVMNLDYSSFDGDAISLDDRTCSSNTSSNASAEESVPWDEV